MAKKTRKSSRKSRRRTRRQRGGSKHSYPIIPADAAVRVSTAGENSDNLMGMKPAK
jgi:hypothetical protein